MDDKTAADYVIATEWYLLCLNNVRVGKVVRGLDEAKAGYEAALTRIEDQLRDTDAWTKS